MEKSNLIEPRVLKGFRDHLPETMIPKKDIIRKLENIFELYGFSPIDTPALEYADILLGKGGGETDKQIYRFKDNGDRDVALRFDLTVPLARFVSQHYNELTFPFKRYHIAPVWRGENTQKGRYREFYQCDFDILGSDSIISDYEILKVVKSGFDRIGVDNYIININNRKILNSILKKFNLEALSKEILQTVDKIYKIGLDEVCKILKDQIKIDSNLVDKIVKILKLDSKDRGIYNDNIFQYLEGLKSEIDDIEVIDETIRIFKIFEDNKELDFYCYNPAITRGLDYYTGIVFESFVKDRMEFGSVCSGGRYDNLTMLYSKNRVVGVGGSFGLDRLISLLEDKNMLQKKSSVTDLLIFNLDDNLISYYYKILDTLQKEAIKCEVVYQKQKIANQFKLAEKKKIRFVLINGEDEVKNNLYTLKDIENSKEFKNITIKELINIIKG